MTPKLDSTEEDIRRHLLSKAKQKGMRARAAVAGDRGFEMADFKPKKIEKSKEDRAAIYDALQHSFLFKNMRAAQIRGVIDCMIREDIAAGTMLIKEGDKGDKFYVALTGEYEVLVGGNPVKTLGAGGNFGELALMYDCPRSASIRAKIDCVVCSLDRLSFKKYIMYANESQHDVQVKTLKKVPIMQGLSDKILNQVSESLLRETFDAGVTIIKEGDAGNVFYMVEEGEVDVNSAGNFIRTMGPGAFFGEQALLNNEPRGATCVAKTQCTLLVMDRENFETLFGPLKDLKRTMNAAHRERLKTQSSSLEALAPATEVPDEKPVTTIIPRSKLKIIKDVGRGAFGRVKIVEHVDTNEIYALKVMQKAMIIRTKNATQVVREKQLLAQVQPFPLVVRLESAMQDTNCLYLLQEFINGGDLFHRLYNLEGCFQTPTAQYYACCVAQMLERLHSFDILYRDLKPENLLLSNKGVLKMVDFGMAKVVEGRTYTLCGTPEYMAPEIIHSWGHGKGVDVWALGVLIYEMLCGRNPFEDPSNNHSAVYRNISKGHIVFPPWLRDHAGKQLIRLMLVRQPSKRFGCGKNGIREIRKHAWFSKVDFDGVRNGTVPPPIKPVLKDALDISNFYPIEADDSVIPYKSTGAVHDKVWEDEFPRAV